MSMLISFCFSYSKFQCKIYKKRFITRLKAYPYIRIISTDFGDNKTKIVSCSSETRANWCIENGLLWSSFITKYFNNNFWSNRIFCDLMNCCIYPELIVRLIFQFKNISLILQSKIFQLFILRDDLRHVIDGHMSTRLHLRVNLEIYMALLLFSE